MKIPASGYLQGRAVEEWIGKTPDSKPPQAVIDRLFLRQMGRCALTGRKIMPGDKPHADHIIRLKDGGQNRETNLQLVLAEPHQEKTAAENTQGARERSIRAKHFGLAVAPRKRIQSRPFPPSGRKKAVWLRTE
jgi:5-methylcytosine-specific restriction enzyme A